MQHVRSDLLLGAQNYNLAGSSSLNKPLEQLNRGPSILGMTFNAALQNQINPYMNPANMQNQQLGYQTGPSTMQMGNTSNLFNRNDDLM